MQDPIKKPIIRTENKLVKKEASEVFKEIQMYMGDRPLVLGKSELTPFSIAVDIVCRGWMNVALRDEIYIQLCRQTTRNPQLLVATLYTPTPLSLSLHIISLSSSILSLSLELCTELR